MDYRRNAMRNVRMSERSGIPCAFGESVCGSECGGDFRQTCEQARDCDSVSRMACPNAEEACENDVKVLDTNLVGAPLAMVYSPFQRFDNLFEPEEALCHGTLFMELFKPFYGSRRGV